MPKERRSKAASRRAPEALSENEKRYRTLYETMTQGVVYQDEAGEIVSANPAAERILGLTLAQMQGRQSTDPRWRAIHEDGTDFPGEAHPAMTALKTGQEVRDAVMGVFNPHEDTYRWISINAVPQFLPGERRPYQVYTTFTDITERRRAEARLSHLASFPEINPSPVIELDLAGNISYMNPATQTLFPDMPALGIRHPFLAGCAELTEALPVVKSEMITRELELAGRWYEQSIFYVPINKSIRLYCRDITERRKVEQLKDEFIGLVSHELRTPLTVINGCLSTVLTEWERLPTDEAQQLLRDAIAESESLSHLVENLLELSRFQAKQLALYAEPVNLPSLVKRTVARVKRQAPTHQFTVSVPAGLPVLEADPLRVERILYNLLENAAKYSPAGSRIRVTARVAPGRIVVAVKDQGSGLSASDQARLFSPFQRLEQSVLSGVRGAGLGLIVCRRLVEAHGGEIWVESRKGRGSTFFFSLPVKAPGQAAEDKG